MDLEIVILSEGSQTEKDKYHMISLICGIENNGANEPIYKTEIESDVLNKLTVTKGERVGGGINWESGIAIYTLLYIKQITNKNLLYSTGNSTQYPLMNFMGIESIKRVDICICITDSLCYTAETNTTL